MSREESREEIIRVVQTRELIYQGPRAWVRTTLNRALKGVTEMNSAAPGKPQKLVISRQVAISKELPPQPEVHDCTIDDHKRKFYLSSGRNSGQDRTKGERSGKRKE